MYDLLIEIKKILGVSYLLIAPFNLSYFNNRAHYSTYFKAPQWLWSTTVKGKRRFRFYFDRLTENQRRLRLYFDVFSLEINRGLELFHKKRGRVFDKNLIKWRIVNVPRQPSGTECAICVMRYMSLIISNGQQKVKSPLEGLKRYKRAHLEPMREEWAKMFIERILPLNG